MSTIERDDPASRMVRGLSSLVFGTMLVMLVGCGAQANPAKEPEVMREAAPSVLPNEGPLPIAPPSAEDQLPPAERSVHIQDALTELTEAEHALDRELVRRVSPNAAKPEAHPGPASKSPNPETSTAPPCQAACTALASMGRSAAYLCKLAGPSDSRCVSARDRFRHAGERVTTSCGACEATAPLSTLKGAVETCVSLALAP